MRKVLGKVREMVNRRLAVAADEIFELLERIITEYEEETRAQLYGPGGLLSAVSTETQPSHIKEEQDSEDTATSSDCNIYQPTYPKRHRGAEQPGPSFETPDYSINPLSSNLRPCRCSICEETFLSEEDLDRHMSNHMCPMTDEDMLSLHQANTVQVSHSNNTFMCSVCGAEFDHKPFYESHMLIHKSQLYRTSNANPLRCMLCGQGFEYVSEFERHLLVHSHQQTEFRHTLKNANNSKRLKRPYNKQANKTPKKVYRCSSCPQTYVRLQSLLFHKQNHKKAELTNTFKCTACYCTFSDEKSFTSHMDAHLKGKKSDRSFSCSVCGLWFYTERLLARHQSRHPELRTSKIQSERCCPQCGKHYNNRASLMKHIEMHDETPKSCSCSVCGEIFEAEEDLKEHMYGHTGVTEDTGSPTFIHEVPEEAEEACTGEDTLENQNSSPKSQETQVDPCPQPDEMLTDNMPTDDTQIQ